MISTETDPFAVQEALKKVEQIQAEADSAPVDLPPTRHPVDGEVKLVGGIIDPSGVIDTATVRELNGRDEEIIAKAPTMAKAMIAILNRGVETLGGHPAKADDLDALLSADRDLLLMKIREITFGSELEFDIVCPECGERSEVTLDITTDIPVKYLENPLHDRHFSVELRNGRIAEMRLPTGYTQKNIAANSENKTVAELNTLMLAGCVRSIDGRDVLDASQVLNLGIVDRNTLLEELSERIPGPQWDEIAKDCPNCGEEVSLPLSADQLFRF